MHLSAFAAGCPLLYEADSPAPILDKIAINEQYKPFGGRSDCGAAGVLRATCENLALAQGETGYVCHQGVVYGAPVNPRPSRPC